MPSKEDIDPETAQEVAAMDVSQIKEADHYKHGVGNKAKQTAGTLTEGVTEEGLRKLAIPQEISKFRKYASFAFCLDGIIMLCIVAFVKTHPALYVPDIVFTILLMYAGFFFGCCGVYKVNHIKYWQGLILTTIAYNVIMAVVAFILGGIALGVIEILAALYRCALFPVSKPAKALLTADPNKVRDILEVRRASIQDIVTGRRKSTLTVDSIRQLASSSTGRSSIIKQVQEAQAQRAQAQQAAGVQA